MSETETKREPSKTFSLEKACRSSNLFENLREVVFSHPDEAARNFGLSVMYLLENKNNQALECLRRLAEEHHKIPLIQRRIAEIFVDREDFHKAVVHLKRVLELDKEDLTAQIWLGLSYYKLGDAERGEIIFQSLKNSVFLLRADNSSWTP